MSDTSLVSVVAEGGVRGVTFTCRAAITILLDADPYDGSIGVGGRVLRLLAGIAAPASGTVRVLGHDPHTGPALRRDIALLGDPALLEGDDDVASLARIVSDVRSVPWPEPEGDPADFAVRRAWADRLAAADRARLLLVAHPEDYVDPVERDRVLAAIGRARARAARVVVATRSLDVVLSHAPDDDALGVVLAGGVVAGAAPAHALPWAVAPQGVPTRVVQVVVDGEDDEPAAARLAASLLAETDVAKTIASVDTLSSRELRVHTLDPREVARAIARRAGEGLAVRALTVLGASAADIAGGAR